MFLEGHFSQRAQRCKKDGVPFDVEAEPPSQTSSLGPIMVRGTVLGTWLPWMVQLGATCWMASYVSEVVLEQVGVVLHVECDERPWGVYVLLCTVLAVAATVRESLSHVLWRFFRDFVHFPLACLYLKGPRFGNYLFWSGLDAPSICAQLTEFSALHWAENPAQCEQMIDRKVTSLLLTLTCAVSAYLAHVAVSAVFYGRALGHALRAATGLAAGRKTDEV